MSEMLSAAQKGGPTAVQKAALAAKLGVAGSGVWLLPLWKSLAVGGSVLGVVWAVSTMSSGDSKDSELSEASSQSAAEAPINGDAAKPIDGERLSEGDTLRGADTQATGNNAQLDTAELGSAKLDGTKLNGAKLGGANVKSADQAAIESRSASNEVRSGQERPKNAPTEATLIKGARSALETSPQQALALLTQHAALYPKGVLAEEREVLRIRALKNTGRQGEAETEEQKFRKAHPESVHHLP